MSTVERIGISLPKGVVQKIDAERGDVPRSRYVLRLVENSFRDAKVREQDKE